MKDDFRDIAESSRSKSSTIAIDIKRAARLRHFVRTTFTGSIGFNKRRWAAAFASLRRSYAKGKDGEIDQVLDFIIETKLKRPKIRDGRDLLDHYHWVCDLMEKYVVVSDEAVEIYDQVRSRGWPPSIKNDLLDNIQRSLTAARRFRIALEKWLKHLEKKGSFSEKWDADQIRRWFWSPENTVLQYTLWMNEVVQAFPWLSWSESLVWDPLSKYGARFGAMRTEMSYWSSVVKEIMA